jgi:hypothetical protein
MFVAYLYPLSVLTLGETMSLCIWVKYQKIVVIRENQKLFSVLNLASKFRVNRSVYKLLRRT